MGAFANSGELAERLHYATFHLGLHCLIKSWTEMHSNLDSMTCDPFKYKIDKPILILSCFMKKSARIKSVK